MIEQAHATTIIGVRRDGRVALGGDGQVTLGSTVMKKQANKIRKLHQGSVLVGFAGSAADAFSLLDRQRLQTWQRRFYAEVETAANLLLPSK